jgi:hypothetical protein
MKDLIEAYITWLKQKIDYREINGYYEVTTPFVNHINDYIQFYLKRDVTQAIAEYGIYDFSWKNRENLKEKLAA